MRSLECDLRYLDQTLLLPTGDHSGLTPRRLALHVFQEIYRHGKNPNGKYWEELDGSGRRFNLLGRVCERVPRSAEWLLRDFLLYVGSEPPPILESRGKLLAYINERGLAFVPPNILFSLQLEVPALYEDLERQCIGALIQAATPNTLLFLFAFLHEITWRGEPLRNDGAVSLAEKAVDAFLESFALRGFSEPHAVVDDLRPGLHGALQRVAAHGARSGMSQVPAVLEEIPMLPFLMENNQDLVEACACLRVVSLWSVQCVGRPLPERYRMGAFEGWMPTHECVDIALKTLLGSMLRVHHRIADEYRDSLPINPAHADGTRLRTSKGTSGQVSGGTPPSNLSSRGAST
ncbi:hypothetical protein ACHZ97_09380 [Lysobacter soli]|uniref:hypothetical protein n=1 Tax=Lysobacter soli TaxID=453783 RepID=UPI0037C51C91